MRVLVVNGLPGSGKTTLARKLSGTLDLPLFCKDSVKETLGSVIRSHSDDSIDPAALRPLLGRASVELLWTLLGDSPSGGVVESPLLAHVRADVIAGLDRAGVRHFHEIWCDVPLPLARQRYADRGRDHWVHTEATEENWAFWSQVMRPIGVGPVHRVDTSRPVEVPELVAELRRSHATCTDDP